MPSPVPAVPPVTLGVFGAAGDPTRRLLIADVLDSTGERSVGDGLRLTGIGIDAGNDDTLRESLGGLCVEPAGARESAC